MSKAQVNTKKNLKDEDAATLNKKQKVGEDEGKKVAQKNKKVQSDSESESEVVIVPTKKNDSKAAGKAVAAKKKANDSDSESSLDEDLKHNKGKAANGAKPAQGKAPAAQTKKPAAKNDSDDESDKPATKKPAAKKAPKVSSDEESSEEEAKPATKKGAAPAPKGKTPAPVAKKAAKKDSDSDEESDEPVKPQKTVATSSKAPAKKAADSDEESSEDEKPKKGAKAPAKAPAKKAIQNEDSEDEEEEKAPVKKPEVKYGGAAAPADGGVKGQNEVFVGNLPFNATEQHITDFFSSCGEVVGVNLLKGYDGRSKGIAFVRFADEDQTNAAVEQNGADYDGRAIKVEKSTPKEQRPPREGGFGGRDGGFGGNRDGGFNRNQPTGERDPNSTTVFVGNLSYDTSAETLRSFFESCGAVNDVRIAYDKQTQQPRGFGHVEFASTDAIDKAIAKAGQKVDGRQIRVDFSGAKKEGGAGGAGGFGGRGGFGGGRGGFGGGRGGFGGGRGGYDEGAGARKGNIGTFAGNKVRL